MLDHPITVVLNVFWHLKATGLKVIKFMGLFQKIGKNNGRHFFFLNLQNGLTELINYVMFIQFLLHIYIRDKIFSFLSVVQKHSYFLSKMS